MDRAETGIKEFDSLVEGGFPRGFNVLVVGAPGTGKTLFGIQYLFNGARAGEPGVYISLDMEDGKLKRQAEQLGWDVAKFEKENKISIVKVPLNREKTRIFDTVQAEVERIGAKRIVFDSLAAFAINIDQFAIPLAFDDEIDRILGRSGPMKDGVMYEGNSEKRITYLALNKLSEFGTTNMIITDTISDTNTLTVDGVSEYVCDGLVVLKSLAIGETLSRTLEIKKMRCSKMDGGIKSYKIDSGGISLN
jgi:circadian clock protein KaiC